MNYLTFATDNCRAEFAGKENDMTEKHSKLPWMHGTKYPCRVYPVDATAQDMIIYCTSPDNEGTETAEERANAAFIVRACNAHEELVGALRMFVVKHDRLDMSDPMQAEAFMIFKDESMLARMALARAALDKAKGEA